MPVKPICTGISTVPAPMAMPMHSNTQPKSYFVNGIFFENGTAVAVLLLNCNVLSCIEPPAQNTRSPRKRITRIARLLCLDSQQPEPNGVGSGHIGQNVAFLMACSRSLIISSGSSRPTERRISPSVIPALSRSSGATGECVIDAGC